MDLWIIGTGESSYIYRNEIKRLINENTLAFHRVFPYCKKYFDFYPSYWTWFDPDAALQGIHHILNSDDRALRKMRIVVPDFVVSNKKDFLKNTGGTPIAEKPDNRLWNSYVDSVQKMSDKLDSAVTLIPAISGKRVANNKAGFPHLRKEFQNPVVRFSYEKMIIGSGLRLNQLNHKKFQGWEPYENKLSMCLFPLAHHLGAKRVFVVGFDCKGGRFYKRSHKLWKPNMMGIKQALKYIDLWKQWQSHTGMEIYSVVEKQHTLLNQYLPYYPFKQLLEEKNI